MFVSNQLSRVNQIFKFFRTLRESQTRPFSAASLTKNCCRTTPSARIGLVDRQASVQSVQSFFKVAVGASPQRRQRPQVALCADENLGLALALPLAVQLFFT